MKGAVAVLRTISAWNRCCPYIKTTKHYCIIGLVPLLT
jgi:hypothetical protein